MTKRDKWFEQISKIADVQLKEKCEALYDGNFPYNGNLMGICSAIWSMCYLDRTREGVDYWIKIAHRTDLETNPYVITKR